MDSVKGIVSGYIIIITIINLLSCLAAAPEFLNHFPVPDDFYDCLMFYPSISVNEIGSPNGHNSDLSEVKSLWQDGLVVNKVESRIEFKNLIQDTAWTPFEPLF